MNQSMVSPIPYSNNGRTHVVGHLAHNEVSDALVNRVHQRILAGMGLIVLHSGHYSKIFKLSWPPLAA